MKNILTICGCLLITFCFGQSSQSGDIEVFIDDIIDNMPDLSGNDFSEPTSSEFVTWQNVIADLLLNDAVAANLHADSIDYEIVLFTDNTISPNKLYYILQQTTGSLNYWGTYVFNPSACRSELIIQSPHPKYDTNTGNQGIYCFKNTDARVFCLSGTHRCNHSTFSSCSGTSSVCSGSSAAFQISDMPHNTNNAYHKTTELLYNNIANSVFVQLHGFGKKSTDPYVIMSNGTRDTPLGTDYATLLQSQLLAEDNLLTFKVAHVDLTWTRLIGFTNTQGRFINGENNPCSNAISTTTGRFIHLEQEKIRLRNDASVWIKVSNALANTFSCVPLPVELSSFQVILFRNNIRLNWTTESEENNDYFEIEKSINGKDWQVIGKVEGAGNSYESIDYEFVDNQPFGGVNYYRIKQTDLPNVGGKFTYSPVQSIVYKHQNQVSIYPNPSTGVVFIQTNKELHNIKIFNQLGILVQTIENANSNLETINLPKGIYYIQVISKSGILTFQQLISK